MAPFSPTQKFFPLVHRTAAFSPENTPVTEKMKLRERKYKTMEEILAKAKYAVVEREDYSDVKCEECRSGESEGEILLCDKCDKGFHMNCVRPIVVRVPIGSWLCPSCSGHPRVRSRGILFYFGIFFVCDCLKFLIMHVFMLLRYFCRFVAEEDYRLF